MTLDEDLAMAVDREAEQFGITRSAFMRDALRAALREVRVRELEKRHRDGYAKVPVRTGECDGWEQAWGDQGDKERP